MNFSDPVAVAQALLRCRSITPDHNEGNDDGAMDLLQGWLTALSFEVTRYDRGRTPNLYAKRGTNPLCFGGHTDVVPPGPLSEKGGWTHDPFGGAIVDGYLYGRGAVDMKGAIAAFIAATARQPDRGAALLITGDEEGSATDGTRSVLEELEKRGERIEACIVGEPTSGSTVGDTIKTGRRGSINGRITVHGAQGHSAYAALADNPIPKLARLIEALAEHEWDQGTDIFPPTTLAFTNLVAGTGATNVIPGSATATFNIRFNPLHTPRGIEATLNRLYSSVIPRLDRGIHANPKLDPVVKPRDDGSMYELTLNCSALPFQTEPGAFLEEVRKAVEDAAGITPALSTDGGTSDARFISRACANTVELGLCNATAHKIDERVPLTELETLTQIYERILAARFG